MKMKFAWLLIPFFLLLFVPNLQAFPVAGSSSGTFENPVGPSGMVVSGVGSSNFSWGIGIPPSSMSFASTSFSGQTDDVFSFGQLNYHNGTIALGTEATAVDLNVMLSLTAPSGVNTNFIYNLGLINTLNTGDPVASADYVYLPTTIPDNFFTVAGINYTLEFLGFGTISGSGFSTVDQFHILEGQNASAQLLGRITAVEPNGVPEPAGVLFLAFSLIGMTTFRRMQGKR